MRIDELERLAAAERAGQGHGHDTSQHSIGHVTFYRPPTIQERIYNAVLTHGGAATRGQIAAALGLCKTPWLVAAIERCVYDGYLRRSHGRWKNGVLMYVYEVAE